MFIVFSSLLISATLFSLSTKIDSVVLTMTLVLTHIEYKVSRLYFASLKIAQETKQVDLIQGSAQLLHRI